ncbi:amidohydrolase family protein [Caulobacter sp. 602-1]|uniref:amidohydrolase family protein n=1 Tax=Caulobacter sp. 602-1 TaxID=2492472 RepID=UPI000F63155E|nr:amidohydrolase family protein [Caulobacter sp. 602-1]RRN63560.1 imidazolonepropionase [Caulobacter sp. 602-1]
MKPFSTFLAGLLAGAAIAAPALAGPATAIVHARLLTMGPAGEIADGAVIMRDGKIVAVGANLTPPAGATIIDAKGAVVTPGLFAANTVLGVREVNSVKGTDDAKSASSELGAAFEPQYGLNPETTLVPIARLGGVTRAIVVPAPGGDGEGGGGDDGGGSLFAGQAFAIRLAGDLLFKPRLAVAMSFGENGAGGSRGAEIGLLRARLDEVRFYKQNRAAYDRGETRALALSREDLEALIPVVEGREPLLVTVHRASDIRQVLAFAREQRLRVILNGAEEGWRVAADIAAAKVPVILNATADLPRNFEIVGASLENAARLRAAGVEIAIVSPDPAHRVRELRYEAGSAVAQGLPYGAALEAITVAPARIFGLADQLGSLQPGRVADLVVWDGDPLEPRTLPTAIYIDGIVQPLRSRALDLRDRYETGDGASR